MFHYSRLFLDLNDLTRGLKQEAVLLSRSVDPGAICQDNQITKYQMLLIKCQSKACEIYTIPVYFKNLYIRTFIPMF